MAEWLRQPGFMGTHATIGADLSQFMATLFTVLFLIGWFQARKTRGTPHHWLMLGGMVSMLAFFVSYYLFRQLGVLAFEGKEGFGGPQSLYDNVFIPLLTFHIILVVIGLIMAVYMIVLGLRAQLITGGRTFALPVPLGIKRLRVPLTIGGKRTLKDEVLQTSWARAFMIMGVLAIPVVVYLLVLATVDRFGIGKLIVWVSLLVLVGLVFSVEMAIQRIWPNGARRHRVLGRFTMIIYCVLFVTGTVTYTMLYILYPGKIG